AETAESLARGEHVTAFTPDTVCDGLRGTLGAPNFGMLRTYDLEVVTVPDADTIAAMRLLWQRLKLVVEPSSAIAFAAVLAARERLAGKRVGVLLTGGSVDLDALPWHGISAPAAGWPPPAPRTAAGCRALPQVTV